MFTHMATGLCLLFVGTISLAAEEIPQSLTLDGVLYSGTDARTRLLDTGVFQIQILDSSGTCVLYEETQIFDTRSSGGAFNVDIGERSSGTAKRTAGDSGNTLAKIFANDGGAIAGKLLSNGSACNGTATAGLARSVLITVIPDSNPTPRAMTPFVLNSVPSALVAERSESLEGLKANSFLQVKSTVPYSLSQSNLENVFSTTNYTKLVDLLSGASVFYVKSGANGSIQAPVISGTPSSPVAGQIWYDAGVIKYYDGMTTQALSAGSGITSLTIGAGLTPTGTITTGGSTITVDVGTTAGKIVQVQTGGKLPALDGSDLTGVVAAGLSGTASISTTGTIGSGAITSSGFVAGTETRSSSVKIFRPSTSDYVEFVAPASLAAPVTYTLPGMAPGVAGYVLSSDTFGTLTWVPQTSAGLAAVTNTANLANGKVWIGDAGGKAQEQTLSGDATITAGGVMTVARLQGVGVSLTAPTTAGQALRYNGTLWAPGFIGMQDLRSNVTGTQSLSATCSSNQTLTYNSATDSLACTDIAIAGSQVSGVVLTGGQNGAVTAGTNDANSLVLETSGTPRMTILADGSIGIGTETPNATVDIFQSSNETGVGYFGGTEVAMHLSPASDQPTGPGYSTGTESSALAGNLIVPASSTQRVNVASGVSAYAANEGTGAVVKMQALEATAYNDVAASITDIIAGSFYVESDAGTTTNMYGTKVIVEKNGGSTTNAYGLHINNDLWSGSIANRYGIYLASPNGAATNEYGLYQSGSAVKNYFSGSLGIGTNDPSMKFDVYTSSNGTAGMNIRNVSSGTSARTRLNLYNDAGYASLNLNGSSYTTDPNVLSINANAIGFSTAGVDRVRVDAGGRVGIGTTVPTYLLDVISSGTGAVARFQNAATSTNPIATFVSSNSSSCALSSAGNLYCSSDTRLKKDIRPLANVLQGVMQLDAVEYRMNDEDSNSPLHVGFKAQQVKEFFPQIVTTDERGFYQLSYAPFVAVLTKALQELSQKIEVRFQQQSDASESLAQRFEKLENQNETLKQENELMRRYFCAKDPQASICR